jgi:hypothetical protein
MLPLRLFRRRNFAVGNLETFAMYGGLGALFFFLVLFLQQVAGYDALQAGIATLPSTVVMFLLSKRAGRLADRFGPRLFMGLGPITSAVGLALMLRIGARFDYWTDLLPPLLLFSLGLSATVAPLTATVLADADANTAGIASGVNNAIARVASLFVVAALGALIAGGFSAKIDQGLHGRRLSPAAQQAIAAAKRRILTRADVSRVPPGERVVVARAVEDASVHAFHLGVGISAALVGLGGLLGLVGIVNPRRTLHCEDCAGGQFAGQPVEAGLPVVHLPTQPGAAPAA